MKRYVMAAILAAVTTLGVLFGTGTPASAGWNACPENRFCMWEHTNYWGRTSFVNPVRNVCYPSETWVSSLRNRTGAHAHIYTGSQCAGGHLDVYPGQSFPSMPASIGDNGMRSYRLS